MSIAGTRYDRLDSFPEPWKPTAGDRLVGKIIAIDTRETEYGEYPIVIVATEDGREVSWHAYHTVAKNDLARLEPEVGEHLGVKYFGRAEGQTYERYRVLMLDREAAQTKRPDWQSMRDDAQPDEDAPSVEPELPAEPQSTDAFAETSEDDISF